MRKVRKTVEKQVKTLGRFKIRSELALEKMFFALDLEHRTICARIVWASSGDVTITKIVVEVKKKRNFGL